MKNVLFKLSGAGAVFTFLLLLTGSVNAQIDTFSPATLTAGTGTLITIMGSNFGATGPSSSTYVEFRNADDGGASYIKPLASDYISYSSSQIIVKVPKNAGTGNFRVTNGSTVLTSATSLTITYALINSTLTTTTGGNSVQSSVVNRLGNTNGTGGYTFQLETSFNANVDARESFTREMEAWRCATGINWTIGDVTTNNVSSGDGVSVVRFATAGELDAGILGQTISRGKICTGATVEITETDMVYSTAINWNFTANPPTSSQYDFRSVILHELGHAHQLAHVIDNNDLMHYAIGFGVTKRTINSTNLAGANAALSNSGGTIAGSCYPPMTLIPAGSCSFTTGPQTITFAPIPAHTTADPDFDPGATANSGLAITYTSSNPAVATIVSGKVHIVGIGTTIITASQPGGTGFTAATPVSQTLNVTRGQQTVTFAVLPAKTFIDGDFPAGATASSGLAITYSSSNPLVATISATGVIHITGVGTTTITATQAGDVNFFPATAVSRDLVVSKAPQTITFAAVPVLLRNGAAYTLQVSASSTLPVTVKSGNAEVATVTGTTLQPLKVGTAVITASQAGNTNFLPAADVSITVRVTDVNGSVVKILPAVSPNNDGINDYLQIEGIKDFPDNNVSIFTRNNVEIMKIQNYNNQDRVFAGKTKSGDSVQEGTYFYLLQFTNNGTRERRTGYFVIKY